MQNWTVHILKIASVCFVSQLYIRTDVDFENRKSRWTFSRDIMANNSSFFSVVSAVPVLSKSYSTKSVYVIVTVTDWQSQIDI